VALIGNGLKAGSSKNMNNIFVSRTIFIREVNELNPVNIKVYAPIANGVHRFVCKVDFEGMPNYCTNSNGIDSMHSVECALAYIKGVYQSSLEPEFFDENGDSLLIK
jgi:hypothetical protein